MIKHLLSGILLFCFMVMGHAMCAQLPKCSDTDATTIYFGVEGTNNGIFNYNSKEPVSATNPIPNTIPTTPNRVGLAVSPNITTGDPTLTFYTVCRHSDFSTWYYYYDGSSNTWVNTGHYASAVNLGAGGGYIYSVIGGSGYVYKYDGTKNDVFLIKPDSAGSVAFDIIADNEGNFYLLSISSLPLGHWMRKYNSSGVLLQEWQLAGLTDVKPHAGFAFIDNTVYFDVTITGRQGLFLYKGVVCGDTIHFNMVDTFTLDRLNATKYDDFASCPKPLYSYIKDTICYASGTTLNIKSSGNGPYSYTVLNGSAQVIGSGPEFAVSPRSLTATVLLHATNYCNNLLTDTFTFIRSPALDAGNDAIILGCGQFLDTLHASLSDTIAGLSYSLNWSPTDFISSGETTLNPEIQPTANTTFTLKLMTPHCGIIKDTVSVTIKDITVKTSFSFNYNYGCISDTVTFNNTSSNNTHNLWRFGDNNTDNIENPVHIYTKQDSYKVTLLAWNECSSDSITQTVDIRHPLMASFIIEDDTICQGSPVNFTNTSEVVLSPAIYHWDLGDGTTDDTVQAKYLYKHPGKYKVQLVVTDSILCSDTFSSTVIVDSLPALSLSSESQKLCVGESVIFKMSYTASGNSGIIWDLGDGGFSSGRNGDGYTQVSHAYHSDGVYPILFTANYRACKDTFTTDTIYVTDLPLVRLESDVALCLNGRSVSLMNLEYNQPGYSYVWNTGDTTAKITVQYPGQYSLTIRNQQGCATTESITIKKGCHIDIPNAFTPNGDGINDYFFPRQINAKDLQQFKLQIFNRWGQLLFETSNPEGRGWDGRLNEVMQPVGVYVYHMETWFKDSQSEIYKGNVTLVR